MIENNLTKKVDISKDFFNLIKKHTYVNENLVIGFRVACGFVVREIIHDR